jgi:nucleoside-diphosphate-sugar epimerase
VNILVTGANGFLGKEMVKHFSAKKDVTVFPGTRQALNLLDPDVVKNFFARNKIEVVLHTAVQYGDTMADCIANLLMFQNLTQCSEQYGLMIYFGSGAEFDHTKDVVNASEEQVTDHIPANYYGLAKNLMTREARKSKRNIINLRLFGCFGSEEKETRFVMNSLRRLAANKPIKIHQNREMDFMYVGDVLKVVEYVIDNNDDGTVCGYSDINLCYKNKLSLLDIANLICYTVSSEVPIIIEDPNAPAPIYTGDSTRLYELGLDFFGIEEGIKEVYNGNR